MKKYRTGLLAALAMAVLILDSKTALQGAGEGIELCLHTVIPALFPFFVLSSMINSVFIGKSLPILRPLGKLCGLPSGCESLLVLGLIGGYPVGAQSVSEAYRQGAITVPTAKRLLGFCNNAGPSFIFGMAASLFTNACVPWLLWLIQVVSAVMVGILLPGKDNYTASLQRMTQITLTQALQQSLRNMAAVCGWVILFRVYLNICNRWFLWLLTPTLQTIFTGILEMSNGCWSLTGVEDPGIRFLLACCFLTFGGLCVCMQTASVSRRLGLGMYLPGKLLQTVFSFFLSAMILPLLYPDSGFPYRIVLVIGSVLIIAALLLKKVVAKQVNMLYNRGNESWEGTKYVVP